MTSSRPADPPTRGFRSTTDPRWTCWPAGWSRSWGTRTARACCVPTSRRRCDRAAAGPVQLASFSAGLARTPERWADPGPDRPVRWSARWPPGPVSAVCARPLIPDHGAVRAATLSRRLGLERTEGPGPAERTAAAVTPVLAPAPATRPAGFLNCGLDRWRPRWRPPGGPRRRDGLSARRGLTPRVGRPTSPPSSAPARRRGCDQHPARVTEGLTGAAATLRPVLGVPDRPAGLPGPARARRWRRACPPSTPRTPNGRQQPKRARPRPRARGPSAFRFFHASRAPQELPRCGWATAVGSRVTRTTPAPRTARPPTCQECGRGADPPRRPAEASTPSEARALRPSTPSWTRASSSPRPVHGRPGGGRAHRTGGRNMTSDGERPGHVSAQPHRRRMGGLGRRRRRRRHPRRPAPAAACRPGSRSSSKANRRPGYDRQPAVRVRPRVPSSRSPRPRPADPGQHHARTRARPGRPSRGPPRPRPGT